MNKPHGFDERGSGSILTLICLMVVGVAAFIAISGASWVRGAHAARTVADMAALAAAQALDDGGDACAAARVTATANDASLTGCTATASDNRLLVHVEVGVAARPRLPGGPTTFTGTATAGRT
jgi:secretion/DNA translocation related TadE-like protein